MCPWLDVEKFYQLVFQKEAHPLWEHLEHCFLCREKFSLWEKQRKALQAALRVPPPKREKELLQKLWQKRARPSFPYLPPLLGAIAASFFWFLLLLLTPRCIPTQERKQVQSIPLLALSSTPSSSSPIIIQEKKGLPSSPPSSLQVAQKAKTTLKQKAIPKKVSSPSPKRTLARPKKKQLLAKSSQVKIEKAKQPSSSSLSSPLLPLLRGDLNRNGRLDVGDAILLAKLLAKLSKTRPPRSLVALADVNQDGKVSIADSIYLTKKLLKRKHP